LISLIFPPNRPRSRCRAHPTSTMGTANCVKSIVNGKSTNYLGKLYQKKIDGEEETNQKYYSSGSAQIAMRTIQGESDTLQWLLSDHLGSTSTTANADGTWPYRFAMGCSASFRRTRTIQYSPLEEFVPAGNVRPTIERIKY